MQTHSENITEITKAIINLQSELGFAAKDTANPFFKSKYADLASVWIACCALLTKNELAPIQTLSVIDAPYENKSFDKDGRIKIDQKGQKQNILITTLAHSSGQWFKSESLICPVSHDPQGIGSAITYMRRYSLCAILGVIQDDDDGEKAMNRPKPQIEVDKNLQELEQKVRELECKEKFRKFVSHINENQDMLVTFLMRCCASSKKSAEEMMEYYKDGEKFSVDFEKWKTKQEKLSNRQ